MKSKSQIIRRRQREDRALRKLDSLQQKRREASLKLRSAAFNLTRVWNEAREIRSGRDRWATTRLKQDAERKYEVAVGKLHIQALIYALADSKVDAFAKENL